MDRITMTAEEFATLRAELRQLETVGRREIAARIKTAREWGDLKEHLEKGRPLIVALKPQRGAPLHYAVVAGLDEQQGIVLKNDPAERKLLKQDRANFEKEWRAAGNWTLLAIPQQDGH